MSKRFLVMGSNSFSGSHFAAYLVSLGHTVLAVSRSSLPCKEFLPHYWHYKDELKFEFKKINLNQNQDLKFYTHHHPYRDLLILSHLFLKYF